MDGSNEIWQEVKVPGVTLTIAVLPAWDESDPICAIMAVVVWAGLGLSTLLYITLTSAIALSTGIAPLIVTLFPEVAHVYPAAILKLSYITLVHIGLLSVKTDGKSITIVDPLRTNSLS